MIIQQLSRTLPVCAVLLSIGGTPQAREDAVTTGKRVPTRVTIDKHNRLLMNGKLWFPLGFSPTPPPLGAKSPMGRDALEVIAGAGMNCFRVGIRRWDPGYSDTCADYLDWLGEHGMYGLVYLRDLSVFDAKHPERPDQLRETIQRFRHHPALAVWKNMDEPAWGAASIEGMIQAYRFLKEIDPDHPVWMTHAPRNTVELLREYCRACDIVALDIYPVSVPMGKHSHLPNKEISVVGDYAEWISSAVDGKKPFWMVLQVCWSGVIPPKHVLVYPNLHQERYMVYQAIIKGARGLLFFGMSVALEGRDAELGYNWTFWNEVLRPLLREIGEGSELHSALLAPDSRIPLKAGGAADIEFTGREVGAFLYILAAKREGPEAEIRFSCLPRRIAGDVEVMFEGRTLQAEEGVFTDRFGPNDVHVYKVRLRNR